MSAGFTEHRCRKAFSRTPLGRWCGSHRRMTQPRSDKDQFDQRPYLHFLHNPLSMRFDRPFGRSNAICLLILPRTRRSKTCRSRGVNLATRARSRFSSLRSFLETLCRAIARSIAASSTSDVTGLIKKSSAPALTVRTAVLTSTRSSPVGYRRIADLGIVRQTNIPAPHIRLTLVVAAQRCGTKRRHRRCKPRWASANSATSAICPRSLRGSPQLVQFFHPCPRFFLAHAFDAYRMR
jgi:hypothetical protein